MPLSGSGVRSGARRSTKTPSVTTHVRSGEMDHHNTMIPNATTSLHRAVCFKLVLTICQGLKLKRCVRDGSSAIPWAGLTTHKHSVPEITSAMNRAQCVFSHARIFCLGTASPGTRAAMSLVTCNSDNAPLVATKAARRIAPAESPARKKNKQSPIPKTISLECPWHLLRPVTENPVTQKLLSPVLGEHVTHPWLQYV